MLNLLLLAGLGLFFRHFFAGEAAPASSSTTFTVPSAAQGLAALAVVKSRLVASGVPADVVAALDPFSDLLREGKEL